MYVHWKSLLTFGFVFWCVLWCTDLLGESSWKRCSADLEDILNGQYNELSKMHSSKSSEDIEVPKQKMNWPMLLWNICAFLCSLVFCSILRSMSWIVWKLFKIYNVLRNRKMLTNKLTSGKISDVSNTHESNENKTNCKVLFKNQIYSNTKQDQKRQESAVVQEHLGLVKELEEIKKEKDELSQKLHLTQKENMTARQQIEEYKLETFMIKEKLARTTSTLKENLKYKDFAHANQEMIARKAHNLELHLKEVSRDRDTLRNKLSSLENNYAKLEKRLKSYETRDSDDINLEQFPEKDTTKPSQNETLESEVTDPDNDICKFEKKIAALQRGLIFEPKTLDFEANSKISMDLNESSMNTSNENDSEVTDKKIGDSKKFNINLVKQNLLNYNAYKAQMLRPKLKLGDIKERLCTTTDTTGSSSDETTTTPHRIISSTIEFQNLLKTLNSNSRNGLNFNRESIF